jgi:hypothetical protein
VKGELLAGFMFGVFFLKMEATCSSETPDYGLHGVITTAVRTLNPTIVYFINLISTEMMVELHKIGARLTNSIFQIFIHGLVQ